MLVLKWCVVCRVAVVVGGGREVGFQDELGPLCKCWVPDDRCLLVLLVVGVVDLKVSVWCAGSEVVCSG